MVVGYIYMLCDMLIQTTLSLRIRTLTHSLERHVMYITNHYYTQQLTITWYIHFAEMWL